MSYLSKEQIDYYNENGYIILCNFYNENDINMMKMGAQHLLNTIPLVEIKGIFTTSEADLTSKNNDYFLSSGDKIRIFLEEKALTNGKLNRPLNLAVNKIAHGLHMLDPIFSTITHNNRIKQICDDLNIKNPVIPHSMYIFKPPNIGGKVKPHQDSGFLHTDPLSCLGFWTPMDDTNKENGCLWFIPRSHKTPIINRFKLNKTTNELYYDPPLNYNYLEQIWPKQQYVPIEISKGSLVILHGNLVHMSDENKSDKARHAYTFHVIDGNSEWSNENWCQYPQNKKFQNL